MSLKLSQVDDRLRRRIQTQIDEEDLARQAERKVKLHPELATQMLPQPTAAQMLSNQIASEGRRVRQGEPKLRKWESEWLEIVKADQKYFNCRAQSIRWRLANGAWYKPDVTAQNVLNGQLTCFEVKGGKGMKGVAKGILALKVAATTYPENKWIIIWKDNGQWRQQEIKP